MMMASFFTRAPLLVIALALTTTLTVSAGKSSDKGNDSNDILKTDGNLNWDVFVKLLTSCGTAMNMEGTVKLVNGFASDCGLKAASGKEKMEPYKVACGVTCVYKSMKLITADSQFASDEKEIKKNIAKLKFMEDEDKIKSLAKELIMCSKAATPYSDKNCYSTVPYSLCFLFSLRRICSL